MTVEVLPVLNEMLQILYPEATFTVQNNKITSWEHPTEPMPDEQFLVQYMNREVPDSGNTPLDPTEWEQYITWRDHLKIGSRPQI